MLSNLILRIHKQAKQILSQKNTEHVVFISVDHRKARVSGFDHVFNPTLRVFRNIDHRHLRSRDHQILGAKLMNSDNALDHKHGVIGQDFLVMGLMKVVKELLSIFRRIFMEKFFRKFLKKILFTFFRIV